MDKLKAIIKDHSRWQTETLNDYINRIEGFRGSDFPFCVENAKSLLETIAKQICVEMNKAYSEQDSPGKILKLAFESLGYGDSNTTQQVGRAIANIGTQMSLLRNQIGATSHGRPLEELEKRKEAINKATSDFLLFSTELVCTFLIELFETENPLAPVEPEIIYEDNEDFNNYWDEICSEVVMGNFSFAPSAVLFNLELKSYKLALDEFNLTKSESDNGE
jgi:hypothetical protein